MKMNPLLKPFNYYRIVKRFISIGYLSVFHFLWHCLISCIIVYIKLILYFYKILGYSPVSSSLSAVVFDVYRELFLVLVPSSWRLILLRSSRIFCTWSKISGAMIGGLLLKTAVITYRSPLFETLLINYYGTCIVLLDVRNYMGFYDDRLHWK